jgi:hypothetical protein
MERIAEQVGVSNTPVREGLLALRSEGFVQLVPQAWCQAKCGITSVARSSADCSASSLAMSPKHVSSAM